jgi:hypothetical protein
LLFVVALERGAEHGLEQLAGELREGMIDERV